MESRSNLAPKAQPKPNALPDPILTPEQLYRENLTKYDGKYTTLVDYLTLIGPSTEDLRNAIQQSKVEQSKSFPPHILSRLPHIDKPSIAFPNQVTEFCFPDGISVHKSDILYGPQTQKFRELVLTSADGQSIYVVALVFFEDLAVVEEAMNSYKEEFKVDQNDNNDKSPLPFGRSLSFKQLADIKGSNTTRNASNEMKQQDSMKRRSSIIPFVEEEKDSFAAQAKQSLGKIIKTSSNDKEEEGKQEGEVQQKEKRLQKGVYYIGKAFCLMSRQAFFEEFKHILHYLKMIIDRQEALKAPLEDYLAHLVYSIPAPPRGLYKVRLNLLEPSNFITFSLPPINQMPHANPEFIKTLFLLLDVDNVILLIKRVLLDSNVTIISSINIPYHRTYQNAPVPFLMGIEDKLRKQAEENINDGTYIIDLDINKVISPLHSQTHPQIYSKPHTAVSLQLPGRQKQPQKDDLPDLPKHYADKLAKALKERIKTSMKNKKNNHQLTQGDVDFIRNEFFHFFVGVFQSYGTHFNAEGKQADGKTSNEGIAPFFNYQEYIDKAPNDTKPFFKAFLKAQMFTRLLERKKWPSKPEDTIDLMFFEENLKKKTNRYFGNKKKQIDVPFLEDVSQNHQAEEEFKILQTLKKPDTPDLRQKLLSEQHLVTYHYQNNSYKYKLFPQSFNKEYMNTIFEEDIYKQDKLAEFGKKISSAKYLRVDFNNRRKRVQELFNSMEPEVNVHICWLLIWASTLQYQDEKEKEFRTKQVIEVLQKLYKMNARLNVKPIISLFDQLQLEIFEVLMDSALKYGTLLTLLEIYAIIEEFRLRQNAAIISYLLSGLSQHNLTMVHAMEHIKLRQERKKELAKITQQTDLQKHVQDELKRRIDSSNRLNETHQKDKHGKDLITKVVNVELSELNKGSNDSKLMSATKNDKANQSQETIQASPGPGSSTSIVEQMSSNTKRRSDTLDNKGKINSQTTMTSQGQGGQTQSTSKQFSYLDSKDPKYKQKMLQFKKRSFLRYDEEEEYVSDKVRMLLKESCNGCGQTSYPKDILKYFKTETSSLGARMQFYCSSCREYIFPNLRVLIGDITKFKSEDTLFIGSIDLRQYLEARIQLDNSYRNCEQIRPEELKEYSKNIYWPLIWYFAEFQLPYDFIVPYIESPLNEEYRTLNTHIKVFRKLRLEECVQKQGSVENYVRYAEEQMQNLKNLQESNSGGGGSIGVKHKRKNSQIKQGKEGGSKTGRGSMAANHKQRSSLGKRGLIYSPYKRRAKSVENVKSKEAL